MKCSYICNYHLKICKANFGRSQPFITGLGSKGWSLIKNQGEMSGAIPHLAHRKSNASIPPTQWSENRLRVLNSFDCPEYNVWQKRGSKFIIGLHFSIFCTTRKILACLYPLKWIAMNIPLMHSSVSSQTF